MSGDPICPNPLCEQEMFDYDGEWICEDCSCEYCYKPLTTEDEYNQQIHHACNAEWDKDEDELDRLALAQGLCLMCHKKKHTTSLRISGHCELLVCQDCYDIEVETEAVWTEFIIEHGRKPTMLEYLEAGGVLSEEE